MPLTRLAIERGFTCALPQCVGDQLVFRAWAPDTSMAKGLYGIPEPVGAVAVLPKVVLCPLLAFDDHGTRLGYGGGYYDRAMALLRPMLGNHGRHVHLVGLGFDAQRAARLPREPHDIPLDGVITERGYRQFTNL